MAVHREMHAHSIYDEESGVQRLHHGHGEVRCWCQ
jgi:hypothetical protein